MQSAYSVFGSELHLILDDEFAENYNNALRAFFEAQKNHKAQTGTDWDPNEPLWIDWTDEMQNAFSKFGELMNLMIEVNGGSLSIPEEQMTSDYLIKL